MRPTASFTHATTKPERLSPPGAMLDPLVEPSLHLVNLAADPIWGHVEPPSHTQPPTSFLMKKKKNLLPSFSWPDDRLLSHPLPFTPPPALHHATSNDLSLTISWRTRAASHPDIYSLTGGWR